MKRLITLLLLIIDCAMSGFGQVEDETHTFKYSMTSDSRATIVDYIKDEESIIVPALIDGHVVFRIKKIIGIKDNDKTAKELIIQSNSISNNGRIIDDNKSIKTIVFNGLYDYNTYQIVPFYFTSFESQIDNVIFLKDCNLAANNIITSNKSDFVLKPGKIIVSIVGQNSQTVQMYLCSASRDKNLLFGQERFEYLLNAFEKNGISTQSIHSIDLSQMSTPQISIDFSFAAYNPAEKLAPGATVKISDDLTYQNSSEYTLSDLVNYSGIDTEVEITYTRNDTKGWNSFCLPFDVAETNFNESVEIYEFAAGTESSLRLKRVANGQTTVAKGTPFFVKTQEESLTLKATAILSSTTTAQDITHDSWCLHGSFEEKPIRANTYKILVDGSAFGITNEGAKTYPYRCYLEYIGNQAAPERLSTIIDEETKIEVIHSGNSTEHVRLYDLMGRPRKDGQPGLFVR